MGNSDTVNAYLSSHLSGADVAPVLKDFLRQFRVEDSLKAIGNAASVGSGSLRPSQLALVVRFLLEDEPGGYARNRILTADDIKACCEMAASVVTSPDTAFGAPVSDSAWSMAHRIAYQQFPDREQLGYVTRSLAIYRHTAPGLVEAGGFDFEQRYLETYGLSIDDAWKIGYALTGWCVANPGAAFNSVSLETQLGLDGHDRYSYEKFLAMQSCDYHLYRSMLSIPTDGQPHFEPYNLNPFRKFPILTLPDGSHLLPVPEYLLRRITHGLYYDLIGLDRSGYIDLMGRSFKGYTGKLLSELKFDAVSQLEAGPWLVSNDKTAVLIECITRPFGALSRATGDRAHLHADLARRAGVVDCVKRLQDIRKAVVGGTDAHPGLRGKLILGVVVALEDFYLANGPFIRGVVDEELMNQGRAATGSDIQMAHISGLEAAGALAASSNESLAGLIKMKVIRPEYQGLEMDAYIRHQALGGDYGDDSSLTPAILTSVASAFLHQD